MCRSPAPLYETPPPDLFCVGMVVSVLRAPWAYWPAGLLILLDLLVTWLRVNAHLGAAEAPADPRAEARMVQDRLYRLARSELSEWEDR